MTSATTPKSDSPRTVSLEIDAVTKRYPGVQALRDVSVRFGTGEIHGIVGENGAGKSTLIGTMTGAVTPDSGRIDVFGEELRYGDSRAQLSSGIAAIYQEPSIVPEMPVWANVFLGRCRKKGMILARGEMIARVRELADELGVEVDPRARAGDVPIAEQQEIEIMRALLADHRVLILDEPTSSLGLHERERLFRTVRKLRAGGGTIIYVSHDLEEVLGLCDQVSVMRQGELVATDVAAAWSVETLVRAMLGRNLLEPPKRSARPASAEVMRAEGVAVPGVLSDVDISLHKGEILGIAGLMGSGRTELLRALAGATPASAGRLFVGGAEHRMPRSVREGLRHGIALLPEDRRAQGLVLSLTATENIVLSDLRGVSRGPIVDRGRRRRRAGELAASLHLDTGRLGGQVATLSGGNQQKVVIAKWLHHRPAVLLMDEPTRGIDIGAKLEMLKVIVKLADEGMAVVMVSSELDEVVETADRVMVLADGGVAGIRPGGTAAEELLGLAFGLEAA
jgi:ABC-type sugar transport system ATPase subunit